MKNLMNSYNEYNKAYWDSSKDSERKFYDGLRMGIREALSAIGVSYELDIQGYMTSIEKA